MLEKEEMDPKFHARVHSNPAVCGQVRLVNVPMNFRRVVVCFQQVCRLQDHKTDKDMSSYC